MLYLILKLEPATNVKLPKGMIVWANGVTYNKNYSNVTLNISRNQGLRLLSGKRGLFTPKIGQYIKWDILNNNILIE